MEYFARFNYSWLYRHGRLNMADPLSRNPALALMRLTVAVTTRSKSGRVPVLLPIPAGAAELPVRKRRRRQRPKPVVLSLYDRILQGYAIDPWFAVPFNLTLLTKSSEGFWMSVGKIVVPHTDTLRDDMITEHHTPPMVGHVGVTKVTRAIQRTFWWPKLRSTVQDFISHCHLCQTNKVTNRSQRACSRACRFQLEIGLTYLLI